MKRSFFDLRDGDVISPDEEGMELPDIEAVQEEAARSLADVAKDAIRSRGRHVFGHWMAIEVRDEAGPVLQAKFTFEVDRHGKYGRLSWRPFYCGLSNLT